MKNIILLLMTSIVLFACFDKNKANQDEYETWGNGQTKTIVINTSDPQTYYKIELDSLGKIIELIPYINEEISGTQIYFRDNLEVGALINHEHGAREGFVFEFRPYLFPGFKGLAKDGDFNGESSWYHSNGQASETGQRVNGKNEGVWTEYYESGRIKARGSYVAGKEQDDWVYWDEEGNIDTLQN